MHLLGLRSGICCGNKTQCNAAPERPFFSAVVSWNQRTVDAAMTSMTGIEFKIDKGSPVPAIQQIHEQIKLFIAMGMLKRGDVLPSIREIEKQTGINRGKIHRALLALQQSGLLAPASGKRTTIAISAAAPDSINRECQALSRDIIKRIRKIGIYPMAFARYLSQSMQEDERSAPFIAYMDPDKETALRRADQVSRLWHAFVVGLSLDEFKQALARGCKFRKVLVNHLTPDSIRRLPGRRRIDVIPIEIRYTKQTIRALERIKASSVLVLLPNHARPSAAFIMDQLHKRIKCKDAKLTWVDVSEVSDFDRLLRDSKYGQILVSPGARSKVPAELQRSSRIHLLQMEFDPEGLETARIRAGVIL